MGHIDMLEFDKFLDFVWSDNYVTKCLSSEDFPFALRNHFMTWYLGKVHWIPEDKPYVTRDLCRRFDFSEHLELGRPLKDFEIIPNTILSDEEAFSFLNMDILDSRRLFITFQNDGFLPFSFNRKGVYSTCLNQYVAMNSRAILKEKGRGFVFDPNPENNVKNVITDIVFDGSFLSLAGICRKMDELGICFRLEFLSQDFEDTCPNFNLYFQDGYPHRGYPQGFSIAKIVKGTAFRFSRSGCRRENGWQEGAAKEFQDNLSLERWNIHHVNIAPASKLFEIQKEEKTRTVKIKVAVDKIEKGSAKQKAETKKHPYRYLIEKEVVDKNAGKGAIYCLEFPDGKQYIGMTTNFEKRMRAHKKEASKGKGSLVHEAIRVYEWKNVHVTKVFRCDDVTKLYERERLEIAIRKSLGVELYNVCMNEDAAIKYRIKSEGEIS